MSTVNESDKGRSQLDEPNYGTCENHPHHICCCTDEDRAQAKALTAFVASAGRSRTTDEDAVASVVRPETCPECRYEDPIYEGPGVPIQVPGVVHRGDCPTIPRPSPEAAADLRVRLDDMARARGRAMHEARNIWIGS